MRRIKEMSEIRLSVKKVTTMFLFYLMLSSISAQRNFYNVVEYDLKGDGITNNTAAINNIIDIVAKKGGGTVYFPAGEYLSYTIHMQSNIAIHLDQGAVMIGDQEKDGIGYDLPEEEMWHSAFQDFGHSYWKNSLIYGEYLHDISIHVNKYQSFGTAASKMANAFKKTSYTLNSVESFYLQVHHSGS